VKKRLNAAIAYHLPYKLLQGSAHVLSPALQIDGVARSCPHHPGRSRASRNDIDDTPGRLESGLAYFHRMLSM
jgi:hypothetical protein